MASKTVTKTARKTVAKQVSAKNAERAYSKASGVEVIDGVVRTPRPPTTEAGAREQIRAFVAANKHILDELAKY